MHKTQVYNLKNNNRCTILRKSGGGHGVHFRKQETVKRHLNHNISRTYFLQASDQKTPALNEKSRAVRMCLNVFKAHSVCMLFSGAGVPLIGMFQSVAFFYQEKSYGIFK